MPKRCSECDYESVSETTEKHSKPVYNSETLGKVSFRLKRSPHSIFVSFFRQTKVLLIKTLRKDLAIMLCCFSLYEDIYVHIFALKFDWIFGNRMIKDQRPLDFLGKPTFNSESKR